MTVIAERIIGKPDDGLAGNHLMECPVCSVTFDMRDLGQVLDHVHDGPEMEMLLISETKKPRHPEG